MPTSYRPWTTSAMFVASFRVGTSSYSLIELARIGGAQKRFLRQQQNAVLIRGRAETDN